MHVPQICALAVDTQPSRVLANGGTPQPAIKIYAAVVHVGGYRKIRGMLWTI